MSQKQWLSTLKNELSSSSLASNVVFMFIMMTLEKIVEMEFECPCSAQTKNRLFSVAFFIIPAFMAFTLMMIFQGCFSGCCNSRCCISFCSSSVSALVWLILVFLDGQYYVCANTDWEGRFVMLDKAAPQKWCEPETDDKEMLQQLMRRTHDFFVDSQIMGIYLLIVLCAGLFGKLMKMLHDCCIEDQSAKENPKKDASLKHEDMSVL